jgi:hypothetical protein
MMAAMAGLKGHRRWEWEVEGGEVVVVCFDLSSTTSDQSSSLQSLMLLVPNSTRLPNDLLSLSLCITSPFASRSPTSKGPSLLPPFCLVVLNLISLSVPMHPFFCSS